MTVDLLAATVFRPEGAVLAAPLMPCEAEERGSLEAAGAQGETATRAEGFWAAVMRQFRPAPDPCPRP